MTDMVINAFSSSATDALHRFAAGLREALSDAVTVRVNGVDGFREAILARPTGDISNLMIYSHGSPGRLALNTTDFTWGLHEGTLSHLTSSGDIASRFAPGAHIEILGCNVAGTTRTPSVLDLLGRLRTRDISFHEADEGARCERFVGRLAEIMLAQNGGTVTAYTGYGVSSLGHPDGMAVTAHNRIGSGVFLDSAVILRESGIRNTLLFLEAAGVGGLEQFGGPGSRGVIDEIQLHFSIALGLIGESGGDGQHRYETVYQAFNEYWRGAVLMMEHSFDRLSPF
ncbi:DUF4347 domain-containing protein [Viridibacterium curvum]|uniref:DUF4347 domain-containing protein n=1 Tax=Viridibacterium curvum TaxID=1101404 RepID=A0ABP9QQ71_9RHOO